MTGLLAGARGESCCGSRSNGRAQSAYAVWRLLVEWGSSLARTSCTSVALRGEVRWSFCRKMAAVYLIARLQRLGGGGGAVGCNILGSCPACILGTYLWRVRAGYYHSQWKQECSEFVRPSNCKV